MNVVLRSVTFSVFLASLLVSGCISDQGVFNNVEISGCVRAASDSTLIPGALLIVNSTQADTTDLNGYYEYRRTIPTPRGKELELEVTVTDIDGDQHGVFVARDTLIVEENPDDELNLYYEIDFYVEIVEDSLISTEG